MSIEVSSAVWKHSRQKSGRLLVLLALADYTNSEGIAWPAASTLAKKVRTSKRNVQRCVRELEKAGELEVRRNEGRRGSNIYRIRLSGIEMNTGDAHVTRDNGVAKAVSSMSSTGDISVTQSVNKPLVESTPIVPSGDKTEFWIKVCFDCFKQARRPLPLHVKRKLLQSVRDLDTENAGSLLKFYRYEPLDSREPLYNSRRHSPERLLLDLPRQLALAVQTCPPAKPEKPLEKHNFTLEQVHDYLKGKYGNCTLPKSLEEFESPRFDCIRKEVYAALRARKQ